MHQQIAPVIFGRLIQVINNRPDCPLATYIVALQDSADAVALVRNRVGRSATIEDKGRVSDTLLHYLGLRPGDTKVLERPAL